MSGKDVDQCAAKGGCEPVVKRIESLETVTYDKETGITALNNKKVSNRMVILSIGGIFLGFVGLIFWFSDIRTLARDYPVAQKEIRDKQFIDSERVAKLEEKVKAYDIVIDKMDSAATKLEQIALQLEKNKSIEFKNIKEYNTTQN